MYGNWGDIQYIYSKITNVRDEYNSNVLFYRGVYFIFVSNANVSLSLHDWIVNN